MPTFFYTIRPLYSAVFLIVSIETISLIGLLFTRRFILPHLHYHDGTNDAVSGTVQAIGVFYGITVGLIAVGVWNTNSNAADLVSREASSIGSLYHDVSGYPDPLRTELQTNLRKYTTFVIETAWPEQKAGRGQQRLQGSELVEEFREKLYVFQPANAGQSAVHSETLAAFNKFIENRRLRIDAVNSGLSNVMWAVIWVGAAISIFIAYFYNIKDPKLHAILIALMSAFLAMLIFMIIVNDRPFFGYVSVSSDPYKLILERVINGR